jgi:hypothetical protein
MKNIWTGQDLTELDAFVEDGNPRVIVMDHLPPEANAMALAKYSRSHGSFLLRLKEITVEGWKKFLQKFYVKYGHNSIGDCGVTTACLENISMLATVAYEDYHESAWQEISTRFIKMVGQKIINPLKTEEGERIQSVCMDLYAYGLKILPDHIREINRKKYMNQAYSVKPVTLLAHFYQRASPPLSVGLLVCVISDSTLLHYATIHL